MEVYLQFKAQEGVPSIAPTQEATQESIQLELDLILELELQVLKPQRQMIIHEMRGSSSNQHLKFSSLESRAYDEDLGWM